MSIEIDMDLHIDIKLSQYKLYYLGQVDGEYILFNKETGQTLGLSPLAVEIWEQLEKPMSLERIRDWMLKEFNVEKDRCEKDLFSLCDMMIKQGVLVIEP